MTFSQRVSPSTASELDGPLIAADATMLARIVCFGSRFYNDTHRRVGTLMVNEYDVVTAYFLWRPCEDGMGRVTRGRSDACARETGLDALHFSFFPFSLHCLASVARSAGSTIGGACMCIPRYSMLCCNNIQYQIRTLILVDATQVVHISFHILYTR